MNMNATMTARPRTRSKSFIQSFESTDSQRSSFFDSEEHSDVTIKFGTKSVRAHKVILRSRSEYFDNAWRQVCSKKTLA